MTTRESIISDVTAYVVRVHGGDWRAAFDAEDTDRDGVLTSDDIIRILGKAGVGYRLTRGVIATQVLQEMDFNQDGGVSFDEFLKKMT